MNRTFRNTGCHSQDTPALFPTSESRFWSLKDYRRAMSTVRTLNSVERDSCRLALDGVDAVGATVPAVVKVGVTLKDCYAVHGWLLALEVILASIIVHAMR